MFIRTMITVLTSLAVGIGGTLAVQSFQHVQVGIAAPIAAVCPEVAGNPERLKAYETTYEVSGRRRVLPSLSKE